MILTIMLPAYNEGKVIGSVLESLPKTLEGFDEVKVLVVDDGSKDNTSAIAKEAGATVVRHRMNRGVGLAKITGLEAARRLNTDVVITLDSDGQHDPQDIVAVLKPILKNEADVIVGSRLMNPKGMPFIRRFGNQTMNVLLRVLFGVQTSDSQSGFRAYNRHALNHLRLKTSGYEVDTEILIVAHQAKLRIAEVPIKVIYTEYSKKKGQSITNSLNVIIRLVMHTIIG